MAYQRRIVPANLQHLMGNITTAAAAAATTTTI